MKNIVLLFISVWIGSVSYGQDNNWISLGSPDSISYKLSYVSSQGYVFGTNNITNELVFSEDDGQTWEYISPGESYFFHDNYDIRSGFREDSHQNIYILQDGSLQVFDILQKKFIKKFTVTYSYFILDFVVYDDGRLLVLDENNLTLFNTNGQKIESLNHDESTFGRLFHGAAGQKNYFYIYNWSGWNTTHYLEEYNHDLSAVGLGPKIKMPNPNYEIVRSGNNMIMSSGYSVDGGISWQAHTPGLLNQTFRILNGHDGKVYLAGNDYMYVSSDDGKSYTSFQLPVNENILFHASGAGKLYVANISCESNRAYKSENNGLSWSELNVKTNSKRSTAVYAGLNENIISDNFCYGYLLKDSVESDWKPIEISPQHDNKSIHEFIDLPDGSLLAITYDSEIFKSTDQAKTWRKLPVKLWTPFSEIIMVIKNDILFLLDFKNLYVSFDFGENFQEFEIDDQDLLVLINTFFNNWAFSSHYDAFYHIPFENEILYYNFLTKEKKSGIKILENYHIINPATLYSGSELYILAVDWSTNEKVLIHTHDKGQTFSIKPVHLPDSVNFYPGLWIDQFNNFYLADDEHVLISYDRGEVWNDITPRDLNISELHDLKVSYDRYIYMATTGAGVIKYANQLQNPGKIVVSVVRDDLENCTRDVGEESVRLVRVQFNDNQIQPVNTAGETTFYTYKYTNEIKVLADTFLHEPCQDVYTLTIDSTTLEARTEIPLKVLKDCAKPSVAMSVPFLRRCFDNTYHGMICNQGTVTAENNTIQITLDNFFDFVSASLPVISFTNQVLTLDVKDLEAGECARFALTIHVRCTADLGQTHCIEAEFRTDTEICDQPQPRSRYRECRENIGAYDPNDKNIFINGEQGRSYIEPGEKIEYLIRFQNTGTDTAFTVRIEDPISAKFDITTLQPVAASHTFEWSIEGNVAEFLFPDIRLVDSFTNEPLSHGFIKFEIMLKEGINRGDEFTNEAGIFFDFNLPIITNEVITSYGKPTSVGDPADSTTLYIFPNPAFDKLRCQSSGIMDGPVEITVSDMQGNIWIQTELADPSEEISVRELPSGSYIVEQKQQHTTNRAKLVKM